MATYEVRERVLMNGPGALSDADLLALYGGGGPLAAVIVATGSYLSFFEAGRWRR